MRLDNVSAKYSQSPLLAAFGAKLMEISAKYLRREQAAQYVRTKWGCPCSGKWLAKLAVVGGGPVFRKAGRFPIYALPDLDAWAEGRIGAPRRSTSVLA